MQACRNAGFLWFRPPNLGTKPAETCSTRMCYNAIAMPQRARNQKRTGKSVSETRARIKLVIERTEDGYVAYPLGLKGVVVAQGDTYDEALKEVASAVRFHVKTFGRAVIEEASEAKEVFTAETEVVVG